MSKKRTSSPPRAGGTKGGSAGNNFSDETASHAPSPNPSRKREGNIKTQLTRLASERALQNRLALLAEIMGYGETDLLCYRSPVIPAQAGISVKAGARGERNSRLCGNDSLRARQDAIFDPILFAITEAYGIGFTVTEEIMPIAQPEDSLTRLRSEFEGADNRELAALFVMTPLLGSALLALAVWKGLIPLEQAIEAATLDETFQAEQWGEDAEEKARRDSKSADIRECAAFLND